MTKTEDNKNIRGAFDRPLDAGYSKTKFDPAEYGMAPITSELLVPGEQAPADIYTAMYNRKDKEVEMRPVCAKGEQFLPAWRRRMEEAQIKNLYVAFDDAPAVQDYLQKVSGTIMDNPRTTRRKKAATIQDMAALNLRLMFGGDLSPKALSQSLERAGTMVTRLAQVPNLLTKLSDVLRTDYSLYSHSVNCCMLAMAFGRFMGMPESRVHTLGVGGMLHDVGLSRLPEELVNKRSGLTPAEKELIRAHPKMGYDLMMPVSSVSLDVLKIILHHHENHDGSGYPHGLTGERTPYLARVMSLVDTYDTMTSQRHQDDPMPAYEAANRLLATMGGQHGNDLVPPFIRFLGSPFLQ